MNFLIKLLGSTGTGGIWVYLIIAGVIYAAGAGSGGWVVHKLDGVMIANLHTDVSNANGRTKDAENALITQQKQTALDIARANAETLAARNAQAATAAELTTQQRRSEQDRRTASTKLLDTLKAIPHDQQTALPASSRAYLRGVLDAQRTAAGTAAADH